MIRVLESAIESPYRTLINFVVTREVNEKSKRDSKNPPCLSIQYRVLCLRCVGIGAATGGVSRRTATGTK